MTCSATSLFIVIGAIRSVLIAVRSTRRLFSLMNAFNGILRGFFFQTTVPLSFFLFGAFPLWHSVNDNGWPYRLLSPSMWLEKLNDISVSVGMNDFSRFKSDLSELYERNYWPVMLVCLLFVVGLLQRRVLRGVCVLLSFAVRLGIYWFKIVNLVYRRVLLRRVAVHFIPFALFTICKFQC